MSMRRLPSWILGLAALGLTLSLAGGEARAEEKGATEKLTLAVLPCQSSAPEVAELSKGVAPLLITALAKNAKLDMVEREQLDKVLQEHELGLSGVVDADKAAQIGKLLGAKLIVAARAYVVDKQVFITANVINVETGRLKAATQSAALTRPPVSEMVGELAADINKFLTGDLVVSPVGDEQKLKVLVEKLRNVIGKNKKPVVTVIVPEEHLRRLRPAPVPDPAVTTSLSYLLRKLGFKLVENDSAELDKWVTDYAAGKGGKFPLEAVKTDVVIYGSAFSEFAGTRGNLQSARARAELSAINVKTGEIMAVNRGTASAADVSEHLAGKTALEQAALKASEELIADLVKAWNEADPKK